jgi:hypothetical protein
VSTGTLALLKALRGPVLLTTLGVLLAAHRFTDATFGRTWPVLLIMLGLMKLAERLVSGSAGSTPGATPGAGGM